ncbi:MAG: alpha/beta fold hydrolase, partial [Pseudomonadota bacterium]
MTSILDRRGAPAPLILHLAAAAEISEAGARLAPVAASRDFPWGAPPSSADRKLASTIADAPQIEMSLALRAAGAARLSAMVQGLRRYQASTDRRDLAEPPVFWSSGASRILDYGPEGGRPVLIAPSLINGVDILDLDGPGERSAGSLLRWLAGRGVRPLLLDWGHPGAEEKTFDLADYVERRLIPAFDAVAEGAGAAPAVIGYCMGGALSVALATRRPASRIALIGAPWNFAGRTPMRGALAALGVVGERAALARS